MKPQPSAPAIHSVSHREQLEEVYDVLHRVFPNGRAFFQARLDHDSNYDPATTWAASIEGKVASTVQIFPVYCRIEDAVVKVGGIGSVATLPEYRGQGLVQGILREQLAWMEERQYDLSLLFAIITPFYEKLGWSIVPEPVYELSRSAVPDAHDSEYDIVPFELSDLEAMSGIYEQFNHKRTFTAVRQPSFWTDQLNWPRWQSSLCLVAKKGPRVVAYGSIGSTTEEGTVHLGELCYVQGEEAAAVPLLLALLRQRPDAAKFSAKLPNDHALLGPLMSWGAERQTIHYAMWKLVRFQPLLAKLAAVFARRLQSRPDLTERDICLHLSCEDQHAYFHAADGEVSVEPLPRSTAVYAELAFSQEQLVSLLFQGIADEDTTPPEHSDLLRTLFPQQSSVFYVTDKF